MVSATNTNQTGFLRYDRTVGMTTMRGRGFYYPWDSAIGPNGRIYTVSRSFERAPADTVRVTVLNSNGEYFGVFGAKGEGDGEFMWPNGIAIDRDGRIYVTDEHLSRITVFSPNGDFISNWGTRGTDEGHLNGPSGITIDAGDNVLIADTQNHRIQRFTKNGLFLSGFGNHGQGEGELNLPWGVTTDSENNVYVADWGNDRIQKFSSDGHFLKQFGSPGREDGQLTRPSGVVVDREGYVYIADWGNERIQVLNSDGVFIQKLRGSATHSTWAEDFLRINVEEAEARAKANLEPNIEFFNDDPHEESSHIEKYFWGPTSVILDGDSNLFITEANRHRIQVYVKHV